MLPAQAEFITGPKPSSIIMPSWTGADAESTLSTAATAEFCIGDNTESVTTDAHTESSSIGIGADAKPTSLMATTIRWTGAYASSISTPYAASSLHCRVQLDVA